MILAKLFIIIIQAIVALALMVVVGVYALVALCVTGEFPTIPTTAKEATK